MTQSDASAELRIAQLASRPVETARRFVEMERALRLLVAAKCEEERANVMVIVGHVLGG